MKEQAVEDVLEFAEGLALAADEAAGVFAFHIEQQPLLQVLFLDGGVGETEVMEQLFQRGLRLGGHKSNGVYLPFLFGAGAVGLTGAGLLVPAATGSLALVTFIWAMVSRFCTVQ